MPLVEPLRYDTAPDVAQRLNKTVVRYKSKPVYVVTNGDLTLKVKPLRAGKYLEEPVHSSDTELDISSPPLGYMNINTFCMYVQRAPVRRQYQGFIGEVGHIIPENKKDIYNDSLWDYLTSKYMADLIDGVYTTGDKCLELLKSNEKFASLAFHRKFALVKDEVGIIKLKHMGRTIGWFPPKRDQVLIPNDFHNEMFYQELTNSGLEVRT